jgi:Cu-processing system permease protein
MIRATLIVTRLTLHEAARKRVLSAALLLGLAFVALDAVGFHFIVKGMPPDLGAVAEAQRRFSYAFFTLAGMYAVFSLSAMAAVLLPIDTLSGEIASGVAQTLATRPVRRSEILLGKWLAYVLVVVAYQALLGGGVLAVAAWTAHYVPPHLGAGLPLLALAAVVLVTLSIAGGARLATVTNGMLAFGLYGLAFIGGWVEQVGSWTHNQSARDVGTVASLVMPTEALWQRAAHELQPEMLAQLHLTPFSPVSVPSNAMIGWAAGWTAVVLGVALRGFAKRPL